MPLNVADDWSGNSSPAPCESLTAETAKRLTADSTRDSPTSINEREQMGYGLVGILVIILLIVMIFYFVRRA